MELLGKTMRRLQRVRSTGWRRSLRIGADRACLKLLQRVYGFNAWHADAPLSARPYRTVVAGMVNGIRPPVRCVVEVGCGLGSILSLIDAPQRHGYDLDAGAIRAARFLNGRAVTFVVGDMGAIAQDRIDVLILVNWIHEISPQQLDEWLAPLLPRTSFLLVDAIDPALTEYRFAHDFAFLHGRAREVQVGRAPNEGRRFLLYEVLK